MQIGHMEHVMHFKALCVTFCTYFHLYRPFTKNGFVCVE